MNRDEIIAKALKEIGTYDCNCPPHHEVAADFHLAQSAPLVEAVRELCDYAKTRRDIPFAVNDRIEKLTAITAVEKVLEGDK